MPFEKGHKGYGMGGRKANSKHPDEKGKGALNTYPYHRFWAKKTSNKVMDIEDVDYYLYNDLPLDELYDSMNLKDWKIKKGNWKDGRS